MSLTIEAIYENGVLKPIQPLPLRFGAELLSASATQLHPRAEGL